MCAMFQTCLIYRFKTPLTVALNPFTSICRHTAIGRFSVVSKLIRDPDRFIGAQPAGSRGSVQWCSTVYGMPTNVSRPLISTHLCMV